MNALNHEFDLSAAQALPQPHAAPGEKEVAVLQARWDALHDAANAVAQLAQLGSESPAADLATLPQRAVAAGGWRARGVAEGVDDLAAVMKIGLRALIIAQGEGRDTTAAALTLWREFHAGRKAIAAYL